MEHIKKQLEQLTKAINEMTSMFVEYIVLEQKKQKKTKGEPKPRKKYKKRKGKFAFYYNNQKKGAENLLKEYILKHGAISSKKAARMLHRTTHDTWTVLNRLRQKGIAERKQKGIWTKKEGI